MKNPKLVFICMLFIVSFIGCEEDEIPVKLSHPDSGFKSTIDDSSGDDGPIVLGDKINDPYKLENMQAAYDALVKNGEISKSSSAVAKLTTTHNYLRFLPKSAKELEILKSDTNLILFCHPLDYEIQQGGSYYEDPDLPKEAITALYCTVPVDYAIPAIDHELIYSCFIPDVNEKTSMSESGLDADVLELLEDESYELTNTLSEEEIADVIQNGKKWKYPSGTFQIANHVTNKWIGVSRVRIKIWRATKTAWCWTNEAGYYKSGRSFRYDVHYKMNFESKDGFKIWGNWAFLNEATYDMGKHSKSGLSRDIARNSGAWKWCAVNNAVQRYRAHASANNIALPPSDLRVWVLENNKLDHRVTGAAPMTKRCFGLYGFNTNSQFNTFINYATGLNFVITNFGMLASTCMPDIFINVNSNETSIDNVYKTVFHECAHASHWQKVGNSYWTKYINYIITYGSFDNPYGRGTGLNAEFCGVGEMWGNYIGALFARNEFGWAGKYPFNKSWASSVGNLTELLEEDEGWYNPGFLRRCDNIADITTKDIYDCLVYNTNTFDKLIAALQTKTTHDADVQTQFNLTATDWP